MSSAFEVDSLSILNDTTSEEISFIQRADISIKPIIFPDPADGVVILIDLISFGAGYAIG